MLCKNNAKAYAILSILMDIVGEDEWKDLVIEPYLNGRESGFAVSHWLKRRKATFSENRNSDNIVIQHGNSNDFSMQGNSPTEKAYRNRLAMRFDQYLDAAEWVKTFLFAEVNSENLQRH